MGRILKMVLMQRTADDESDEKPEESESNPAGNVEPAQDSSELIGKETNLYNPSH